LPVPGDGARRHTSTHRVLAALLFFGVSAAGPASAHYWEVVPQLEAGITAESNPRYIDDGADADIESAKGTFVDMRLIGALKAPDKSLTLTPRLVTTNYLGNNQDLDKDDFYVDLQGASQSELGQLDVLVSYADIAVVTAEFEDATPDNPDLPPPTVGGSGRFADATQETWSGALSYSYNLSQRNILAVSANGSTTTYDAEPTAGYFDYSNPTAQITLQHVLNQRDIAFLSLNGGRFTAEAPIGSARNTTDSFGATVGYQRQFNPTLSGTLIGGLSRSFLDITGLPFDNETGALCFPTLCSISTTSRTFVGSLNVRKRSEVTTMNVDISRNLAPNSNGTQYIEDAFRLYVDRELTARLVGTLGMVFTKSQSVADIRRLDQDYYTVSAALRWKLTPTWSLAGNYAYVTSNSDAGNSSSKEKNNALFLSVIYRGVGYRW
jgi:hypothetical protein